jgi:hypothetical protein
MELIMDKQRARQLYELADRLSKLDVNTLSEEQLSHRNTMIAKLQEEVKIIKEFAPSGSSDGGDGFSEDTLKRLAAQWWNGDEDPRVEQTLMSAGWEIGQDEGYDNGGVFVVQAGDINGNSYISWPAEELQQGVAEGMAEGKSNVHRLSVAKLYRQTRNSGQIASWAKKEAGLPLEAKVYFDDADLVLGSETIVPAALVDPSVKMKDLVSALVQATSGSANQGMAEASWVNGKLQQPEDLVWKQTSLSYDEAVNKYGKEAVRREGKNRLGQEVIAVHVPLGGTRTPALNVAEGELRVDSLVTDALKIMRGSEVSDAVSALKTVLGDREYNGRRGHYNFYVKQMMDMYSQRGVAEAKKPSPKLSPVEMKKTDTVSEEINNEAYERLQKVFAFKNYES